MTIQSYKVGKKLRFAESEIAPIHLADGETAQYYSFSDGEEIPLGGKVVREEELPEILQNSQLIRQIKEEANRRILKLAPLWKQQNALADIYLLRQQETLDEQQQKRLQDAECLLECIQTIRVRSNEIEASFLNGVAVDYLTDRGWNYLDRNCLDRECLDSASPDSDGEANAQ